MVKIVTVAAEASTPYDVVMQEVAPTRGVVVPQQYPQQYPPQYSHPHPQPYSTLNQPGLANWQAGPISPDSRSYGVDPVAPRDSGWRQDQKAIGERRMQQDRQRVELEAQVAHDLGEALGVLVHDDDEAVKPEGRSSGHLPPISYTSRAVGAPPLFRYVPIRSGLSTSSRRTP